MSWICHGNGKIAVIPPTHLIRFIGRSAIHQAVEIYPLWISTDPLSGLESAALFLELFAKSGKISIPYTFVWSILQIIKYLNSEGRIFTSNFKNKYSVKGSF